MARVTLLAVRSDRPGFLAKLKPSGDCLLWWGKTNNDGYGRFAGTLMHRVAYEMFRGPIAPGMDVDHICFSRACCRPDHLRLLPHAINAGLQRRTLSGFCAAGHERTTTNVYLSQVAGRQYRRCRRCNSERTREYRQRKKVLPT